MINACDAGREGELIFAYIWQTAGVDKPVERLWISSLTARAIRDGFDHLRPASEMARLEQAARSRAEADWLIGMNATRAATIRGRGRRSAASSRSAASRPRPWPCSPTASPRSRPSCPRTTGWSGPPSRCDGARDGARYVGRWFARRGRPA